MHRSATLDSTMPSLLLLTSSAAGSPAERRSYRVDDVPTSLQSHPHHSGLSLMVSVLGCYGQHICACTNGGSRSLQTLMMLICVILLLAAGPSHLAAADMIVATNHKPKNEFVIPTEKGDVRGARHFLPTLGKSVVAYLGIPFAKPPVGYLRFKHPEPIERWNGVLNATRLPPSCYQPDDLYFGPEFHGSNMWNSPTPKSEDCLYLNVWVPATRKAHGKKLPVLVWIYGGGFYSGTTTLSLYDGKLLAAMNDVIVVAMNYRVTLFGFLALGHPAAPGNAGMYDQLMALEWVQNNIHHFGGNPRNVTIFGESAGAVSVSLHLLSALSADKFERAIMQSGTANMRWATITMEEAKRRSIELAVDMENVECERTDDMGALAACLRNKPAEVLLNAHWVSRNIMQFPFLPVIDGVFLADSPDALLRRGSFKKCPILLGSNKNEGSFFIIYELGDYLNLTYSTMDQPTLTDSYQRLFKNYPQYPLEVNELGLKAIKFQYGNWALNPNDVTDNLRLLDEAVSDCHFICHLNEFALTYAAAGLPVYTYYLTQRYATNPWPEWMGVLHGDDIIFIFGDNLRPGQNTSEDERQLTRDIMRYWTNFAKTGDPNRSPGHASEGVWPLHTPQRREYLELNTRFLHEADKRKAIGRGPRTKECAFWLDYLPQLVSQTDKLIAAVKSSSEDEQPAPCPMAPQPSVGASCREGSGGLCPCSRSSPLHSASSALAGLASLLTLVAVHVLVTGLHRH